MIPTYELEQRFHIVGLQRKKGVSGTRVKIKPLFLKAYRPLCRPTEEPIEKIELCIMSWNSGCALCRRLAMKKGASGTRVKIKPLSLKAFRPLSRPTEDPIGFPKKSGFFSKRASLLARLWRSHPHFPPPCHPKCLLCDSSAHKGPKLLRLIGLAISKSTGKTDCLFNRGLNDSVPSVVSRRH